MILRRKRRKRRASRSLSDRIAIGAMAFSAALLIISAIATDRSPEPGGQARVKESEHPSPATQTGALARRDHTTSSSARGHAEQRGAPARTTARKRSNPANVIADARLSDAEKPDEPENTANLDTPASDFAGLETEPDDTSPVSVVRAQFTTGIAESQPVNSIRSVFSTGGQVFSLDGRPLQRLYYFTEINATRGETIVHRWEHEGEVIAETSFDVGGDSWPVYSSENLPPAMPGNWRVVVTDAQGNIIRADRFSYQAF